MAFAYACSLASKTREYDGLLPVERTPSGTLEFVPCHSASLLQAKVYLFPAPGTASCVLVDSSSGPGQQLVSLPAGIALHTR